MMQNNLVFFGSYADADKPGVYLYDFDSATGALEPRAQYAGIDNPSFLVVHPNKHWLYAVSELSYEWNNRPGGLRALRFDATTGAIEPINEQPSGGGAPCQLQFDPSAHWLIVSNYSTGSVRVLPIGDDGALGEPSDHIQHHGSSVHPNQQGPHAHSATFSPDGRFVLVADLGTDEIVVYTFDASAGKLAEHSRATARPGAGPRHLVFHPAGNIVYVGNELDSTISVYDYDASNGGLQERQWLSTVPTDAPANSVADIHILEDGSRVFVSNRGHDSIAAFDIGADGALNLAAIRSCGGRVPRNFAIAPGERWVLAANQDSGDVAVLPLSNDAQVLGDAVARVDIPGASCVQFVGN